MLGKSERMKALFSLRGQKNEGGGTAFFTGRFFLHIYK